MKEIEEDARSQNDQPIHNHGVQKYDCEKCHITKNNLRLLARSIEISIQFFKEPKPKKKTSKILKNLQILKQSLTGTMMLGIAEYLISNYIPELK